MLLARRLQQCLGLAAQHWEADPFVPAAPRGACAAHVFRVLPVSLVDPRDCTSLTTARRVEPSQPALGHAQKEQVAGMCSMKFGRGLQAFDGLLILAVTIEDGAVDARGTGIPTRREAGGGKQTSWFGNCVESECAVFRDVVGRTRILWTSWGGSTIFRIWPDKASVEDKLAAGQIRKTVDPTPCLRYDKCCSIL